MNVKSTIANKTLVIARENKNGLLRIKISIRFIISYSLPISGLKNILLSPAESILYLFLSLVKTGFRRGIVSFLVSGERNGVRYQILSAKKT
jgi:hypothetical protein